MRKIDLNTWERKSHFEWFSSFSDPTFALDVKMDVTKVLEYSKITKTSFFINVLYIVTQELNKIEEFRTSRIFYTLRKNSIYLFTTFASDKKLDFLFFANFC